MFDLSYSANSKRKASEIMIFSKKNVVPSEADIKNRGVEDILIVYMDGLTGFPDAVRAVFPDTHIQHCIVHMIRNSTKFVSYKDLKAVCRDLKEVYSAINAESGHEALEEFGKKWNDKYPMIQAS